MRQGSGLLGWNMGLGLLLAVLSFHCVTYKDTPKESYQAPLLAGVEDAKRYVELRGVLEFGRSVAGSFSKVKPLTGYIVNALGGARLTLSLVGTNGEDPVLIVYGPMNQKGIWGKHIALDDDGKGDLGCLISDLLLREQGTYLIAAATYDGSQGGEFQLSLGCQGQCLKPHCEALACNLYCPLGMMKDPDGCPICRCIEVECSTDDDCSVADQDLISSCIDGQCVKQMECSQDVSCPEGFECLIPPCEIDCKPGEDCPSCPGTCEKVAVVCAEGQACTTPSGLAGRCVGKKCIPDALVCQSDRDCPDGTQCEEFCNCPPEQDPQCGCSAVCVPKEVGECKSNADCPAGMICRRECSETCLPDGTCQQDCNAFCVVHGNECNTPEDCIFDSAGVGECIDGFCVYDQIDCKIDEQCPETMICDLRCKPCDPQDPICEPLCEGRCIVDQPAVCEEGQLCTSSDGSLGLCVLGRCIADSDHCRQDADCPESMVCEYEYCLDWCSVEDPRCCYGSCRVHECDTDQECALDNGVKGYCVDRVCTYEDCGCPHVWDPVCAEKCSSDCVPGSHDCAVQCELLTFSNACSAKCARAEILFPGECLDGEEIECKVNTDCPLGSFCEHCHAGVCNDDLGICLPLPPLPCEKDSDCRKGFRCEPKPDCRDCLGQCVPIESECIRTGCHAQVCAPYPVQTSCVWLPEYACLEFSSCEMLIAADGQSTCAWVQSQAYFECISEIKYCQSDEQCSADSFCQIQCDEQGQCSGYCVASECVCPDEFDPVCGTDGVTYDNICLLKCAGIELAHAGKCS